MSAAVHMEPNKLWRSNSISNLYGNNVSPTEGKMAGTSADVWMRGCAAPNYRGCQDGGIFGVVSNGFKGQCHEIFNFRFFS
jgi:hypothetical protein